MNHVLKTHILLKQVGACNVKLSNSFNFDKEKSNVLQTQAFEFMKLNKIRPKFLGVTY